MIYLNGKPLEATRFPDNTTQVWKLPENLLKEEILYVKWVFSHEGEFMELAQLKSLLDLNKHEHSVALYIQYLPYGRQDKDVSNSTTFALHTFANLLNSLEFDSIVIMDPHSEIALDLIDNSFALYPIDELDKAVALTGSNMFCYPDKGAVSKYTKIYNYMTNGPAAENYSFGEKVRDQPTGNIISYQLFGEVKDKTVMIVDDICDGGMTFKILAKDLLAAGAREVNLFVTHGIFSKGLQTLKDSGIKHIFTQDGEIFEDNNKEISHKKL